ncbi:Hsp70 family protein [Brevundimonas sp. Root1279]|uniref:Hsp70 family protein n=1 Tax=Brevundimonas sp. Root1279 TaxID=1736443 RepID=UPI0006FA2FD2|nr:molecular chaperone HscC [Brevundimonas sp. Root1279]KQW82239.1 2-alkenal reductase [Brevundimonas sp. Root1279]
MIIGIDLGTTNSAVGIFRDGKAELIPNSLGHVLTPSAVSLDETSGDLLVGLAARERQSTHPEHTATAFKRYMGSNRVTKLGAKEFKAEELSALVLARLKADAEAYLGQPVTEAVITVPAYFNDKQRKATRRAGELAGLKVERLLNEPTAAALAYGIHELGDASRFLVFDLGGGTFDVSVLEIFEGIIEVRASTGDNRLGGEDFNDILCEEFRRTAGKDVPEKDRADPVLRERIRHAAERARRALTDGPSASMSVIWKETTYERVVTADDFEALAAGLITRLRDPVLRSLRDAGLRADELNEVILVGGSTRMPLVRRAITRMFGRFPANAVNPDEAVAVGAAVQAGLKSRDVALKEVVMTDVCPYTLGIAAGDHDERGRHLGVSFSPIIERNTVIPASRIQYYSNSAANQRVVSVPIFQGESRNLSDNIELGRVDVPIPPGPVGSVRVDVRFTYDINGLLEVDVHIPQTGEKRELVIADDSVMNDADFQKRRAALADLKHHPRDADANKTVLARANRCYEECLGDQRRWIAEQIGAFEVILERQDPRDIEQARTQLTEVLDRFEGETWL